MEKNKLEIVDEIDGKTLAYRNKPSIELYHNTIEVGFSEFSYSWKEIIMANELLRNAADLTLQITEAKDD